MINIRTFQHKIINCSRSGQSPEQPVLVVDEYFYKISVEGPSLVLVMYGQVIYPSMFTLHTC